MNGRLQISWIVGGKFRERCQHKENLGMESVEQRGEYLEVKHVQGAHIEILYRHSLVHSALQMRFEDSDG